MIGVLAYAASYFARGWLAGHQRFALYGGLVFLESTSRFLFALAVAVGIVSGQNAVGLGMAVAPFVSLAVIPFAFSRIRIGGSGRASRPPTRPERAPPTPSSRRRPPTCRSSTERDSRSRSWGSCWPSRR